MAHSEATHSIVITVDTFDPSMVGQLQREIEAFCHDESDGPLPDALAESITGFFLVKGNAMPDDAPDYNDGDSEFFPTWREDN